MKKILPLIIVFIVMIILWVGVAYLAGAYLKLPLPFLPKEVEPDLSAVEGIINQWENVRIYEMKQAPETIEEMLNEVEPEKVVDTSELQFYALFPEIDKQSAADFIAANPSIVANGYGMLFFDAVDVENTTTAIRTTNGDSVLAIDAHDNLMIVGTTVGDADAKLVILKNPKQVGMALVKDINYWEKVDTLAKSEEAILAIAANGYNYNEVQGWFTIYGLAKRNGEVIRKAYNQEEVIGFTSDGTLLLGEEAPVEYLENACEYSPILINNGVTIYDEENSTKMARTVIGQTDDGTTLMLVVDGGDNTSGIGCTLSEAAEVMARYGATKAANLVGGNRTVLWWNGNVVNKPYGYADDGLLLPTAWVIHQFDGDSSGIIYADTEGLEIPNGQTPEDEIDSENSPEGERGPGALTPQG